MNVAQIKELKKILFIDIETVSCVDDYEKLPDRFKPLWDKKTLLLTNAEKSASGLFLEKAAIYAEFGKVIVIGLGFFFIDKQGELAFKVKSIAGHNENEVLTTFKNMMDEKFNDNSFKLCAHNGKEFDYPYLCRRLVINQIPLPKLLQIAAKKPWEVPHLDTMESWKFGDKKAYTSLELLAAVLDVPTSKTDIDGSKVNQVYYIENGLNRISTYCTNDVVVTAQIYLRLNGFDILNSDKIVYN